MSNQPLPSIQSALEELAKIAGAEALPAVSSFIAGIVELAKDEPADHTSVLCEVAKSEKMFPMFFLNVDEPHVKVALALREPYPLRYERWLTIVFRIGWLKRAMFTLNNARRFLVVREPETDSLEDQLLALWFADATRFYNEFTREWKSRSIPSSKEICALLRQAVSSETHRHLLRLMLGMTYVYMYVVAIQQWIAPGLAASAEPESTRIIGGTIAIIENADLLTAMHGLEVLKEFGLRAQSGTQAVIDLARRAGFVESSEESAPLRFSNVCGTLSAIDRGGAASQDFLCATARRSVELRSNERTNAALYALTVPGFEAALSDSNVGVLKTLLESALDADSALETEIRSTIASRVLQILLSRDPAVDGTRDVVERGAAAFPQDHSYAMQQVETRRKRIAGSKNDT